MMIDEKYLFAFALTLFAGLATGIGSLMAFFSKKFNPNFLSAALGFSAGVMIYVSFVEIFFKNPNAYKILSNFTFGNENRIEKVGTKNFWIVKQDGNLYSVPYKQKPKDSDWSKFINLYNPKQMYSTDIYSGTYDSYQIDNDGELAIFNELKFNRKTNSLLCSNGAEYN